MRKNIWSAFLGSDVNIDRNKLAVPVQLLRRVGVIVDVANNPLPLREPHERPWKVAVIKRRLLVFKQKTAYELGLGIPAEPLFRSWMNWHIVALCQFIH